MTISARDSKTGEGRATSGRVCALAVLMVAMVGGTLNAQIFIPMGDLPGGAFDSKAWAVSGDGLTVVGHGESANGRETFRWTPSEGMVNLGELPGGIVDGHGRVLSFDGSIIAGNSSSANGWEWFLWTSDTGMVPKGDLPGGGIDASAFGISADGTIVSGRGESANGTEAFRWDVDTNIMIPLGDLPGGGFFSIASKTSADGSTTVGRSESDNGIEAFRWTATKGMVPMGDLPGGVFFSEAKHLSANGSVIVGQSDSSNGNEAFYWTASSGLIGMGDLPGGIFDSRARAVSEDGTVVVGRAASSSGYETFVWDSVNGMASVRDLLIQSGTDMTGWQLTEALSLSADGKILVGQGTNPAGNLEAWLVDLTGLDDWLVAASIDVPLTINSPKGKQTSRTVVSYLAVDEHFEISDLDVQLDISHQNVSDLEVSLVHNGIEVQLFSQIGGSGNDFSQTILDDNSANQISDGAVPFSGRYAPAQALTAFNGANANGLWELVVSDYDRSTNGTLNSWSLSMLGTPIDPPDPTAVEISINDAQINEGKRGTRSGSLTVSLSALAPAGGVTVNYATADGTALAGQDYVADSGSVSIASGQTSASIQFTIYGDRTSEPDETFVIDLSGAIGADITDSQGQVTIKNDDR